MTLDANSAAARPTVRAVPALDLRRAGPLRTVLLAGSALGCLEARADTPPIAVPTVSVTETAPQDDPTAYAASHATTGTKTDAPLMTTPFSIEVVTPQVLADQQVVSIDQALENVSGITEGGGGANDNGQKFSGVRIRGFDSDAFLLDGTRLYSVGGDSDLYTEQFAGIDRVEVLKGPAAILYGSLEPGGIVNIVSKQPDSAPAYQVQQQFGSYGLYRTAVDATGPLNPDETVLYRLDASFANEGSPIQYIYNDSRFIAPTIRWNIDDATRLTVELKYRYVDFGQNYGTVPLFRGVPVNGPDVNYGATSPERETTTFAAISWSHDFGNDLSLRQRLVFNEIDANGAGILPDTITTGLPTPSGVGLGRQINNVVNTDQNFNITTDLVKQVSLGGLDQTLLAGGDFGRFRNAGHIDQAGQTDGNISYVDFFDPAFVLNRFACCATLLGIDSERIDTGGLYLQDQATLPWRLHLLAGMRWQYLRESSDFNFPVFGYAGAAQILTDNVLTPRVGLLWQATDWLSPYVSYVENFGQSGAGYTLPNGHQVPPSRGTQWEVGAKASFLGDRLTATAAYYDLVKTNIPTPDIFNPAFVLVIGEAESRGVELDIKGEVSTGWNVILTYAHNDVVVTKSSPLDANPVGTHFGGVPDNQARLWTTYDLQSPSLAGWKVGGGLTYAGAAPYTLIGAGPPQTLPSYLTADVMTAYRFSAYGADWTAQLNATNILDRRYITDAQANAFASNGPYSMVTYIYGDRRAVVGSLSLAF